MTDLTPQPPLLRGEGEHGTGLPALRAGEGGWGGEVSPGLRGEVCL
jgi:hypothetical protein